MPSLQERDKILRECWRDARYTVPDVLEAGPHFSVQVMGVVDDPSYMEGAFTDVVAWWPAARKWTITHSNRSDTSAEDFPVVVKYWQPLLPLPW